MPEICECPDCSKSLRIPDERIDSIVKCPGCGRKFRASANSAPADRGTNDLGDTTSSRPRARKAGKSKSGAGNSLQPFLRRWLVGCGVVLGVTALVGVGGIFSEPLALVASFLCIAAVLGCAFGGLVWMVIDLAKENVLLAIGTFFVPPIGLITSFKSNSPARRGAIVYVSLIAPTVLLGLMLLVFYPKYAAGRMSAGTPKWEGLMKQLDQQLRPETPEVAVTVKVASRPGSLDGIQPECEALLRPYKSYVRDSLQINPEARTISYRYRGNENFKLMIAFYLGSATNAFTPQIEVVPQ